MKTPLHFNDATYFIDAEGLKKLDSNLAKGISMHKALTNMCQLGMVTDKDGNIVHSIKQF